MKKIFKISGLLIFMFSLLAINGCEKLKKSDKDLLLAHTWNFKLPFSPSPITGFY